MSLAMEVVDIYLSGSLRLKCVKDLLLEEILCCITYNIRKLRKLREYMKVKLRKFCEVMKIFRERSYENFYNPPSSDGGA